jgi:hypothetical protein
MPVFRFATVTAKSEAAASIPFFRCKFLEFLFSWRKVGEGDVWGVQVFWGGSTYIGSLLGFTGVRFVVQSIQFVKTFS